MRPTNEQHNRTVDALCNLRSDLPTLNGLEWYSDNEATGRPVPLEDNFSEAQAFGPASHRFRFDVHLYSTVDCRHTPLPQVAAGFRKMAEFLESQAVLVEEKHRLRTAHATAERKARKAVA